MARARGQLSSGGKIGQKTNKRKEVPLTAVAINTGFGNRLTDEQMALEGPVQNMGQGHESHSRQVAGTLMVRRMEPQLKPAACPTWDAGCLHGLASQGTINPHQQQGAGLLCPSVGTMG